MRTCLQLWPSRWAYSRILPSLCRRFSVWEDRRHSWLRLPDEIEHEALTAAGARFESMGDEVPEDVRGQRTPVDVYEVIFAQSMS